MTSQRDATVNQPHPVRPVERSQVISNDMVKTPDSITVPFVSMALTMSWQLALVVLIPIIGGHFLDQQYKLTPTLTLAGLGLAVIAVFAILLKTVAVANTYITDHESNKVQK
jgi:hypothetical protein